MLGCSLTRPSVGRRGDETRLDPGGRPLHRHRRHHGASGLGGESHRQALAPVDMSWRPDFVGITGKISPRGHMYALAAAFRARGSTVLIGGSFASLSPDDVRPHADILVTGEIEGIAPAIFADLAAGRWRDRYDGGFADVTLSPVPRWDVYPLDRAMMGAIQTSRGCPFQCEFCDVIQYQGRKQRHKHVAQVLAELDALYAGGVRHVFLADDNFTVHRRRAQTVLAALADWNARHRDDPVRFITQASMDAARDPDLLAACVTAGLDRLFVGIETINEASLRETSKPQNHLQPISGAVDAIVSRGIAVQAGIIVGFDHDDPGIFERLFEFFQASPLPDLAIGSLVAPPQATPLYDRLGREGRLLGEAWNVAANSPFSTNIVPRGMTRDQLLRGLEWLCDEAYRPVHFERRMLNFIDRFGESAVGARHLQVDNARMQIFRRAIALIRAQGPDAAAMLTNVLRAATAKPATLPSVVAFLCRYAQFRHFLSSGVKHAA